MTGPIDAGSTPLGGALPSPPYPPVLPAQLDNIARVQVLVDGAIVGYRRGVNFVTGNGVTLTAVENDVEERVDITVTSEQFTAGDIKWSWANANHGHWFLVNGQAFDTGANPGLFALFPAGTVPDARGRTLIMAGTGSGLTARTRGVVYGEETHILTLTEIASHQHGGDDHYHDMSDHTHDMNSHTHDLSDHGHNLEGHEHSFTGSPARSVVGDFVTVVEGASSTYGFRDFDNSGTDAFQNALGRTAPVVRATGAAKNTTGIVGTGTSAVNDTTLPSPRYSNTMTASGTAGSQTGASRPLTLAAGGSAGTALPHENMQPSLGMNLFIYGT